jgi:hypothetical protein
MKPSLKPSKRDRNREKRLHLAYLIVFFWLW